MKYSVTLTAVASIQMKTTVEVEADSQEEANQLAIELANEEDVNFEPDVWDDNDVDAATIEVMGSDDE
jgi:hypothetical protein